MNRCRALLADLAFRVAYKSSTTALDHNRPLIVPAGSDDLASIGPPPVAATTAAAAGARRVGNSQGGVCLTFPMSQDPAGALEGGHGQLVSAGSTDDDNCAWW
jgi:hypothetical protein